MQEMSERYWKQFAAMEKMVNYYNSMSNWLSQQVAQMAGQNPQPQGGETSRERDAKRAGSR